MSKFNTQTPVRNYCLRPSVSQIENAVRQMLRQANWNAVERLVHEHCMDTEDIEGCLMFISVSLTRNPARDEHLLRCADLLLSRLQTPLQLVDLLTYTRHTHHRPLIQKFIPHCSVSVVNAAVFHASKHGKRDLFELLYPYSNTAQVAKLFNSSELLASERFLFDERQRNERCQELLKQVMGEHGKGREARKL